MANRHRRKKEPLYFQLVDGGLFAFAGLWTSRRDDAGQSIESCTIITTRPNELVAPIHDRMPVISLPGFEQVWLDVDLPRDHLIELLQPSDAAGMTATLASRLVNSVKNDAPELLQTDLASAA